MYLGIDLTSGPRRASAYAFLDDVPAIVEIGLAASDGELEALPARQPTRIVAIDAPLFLPQGWRCRDWPCSCGLCPPEARRWAEKALAAEGIGLFWTTKRSIIKNMIKRAMKLRRALEAEGFSVMEVYPYASKVRLFGKPIPKKKAPEGRRWLRQRLEPLIAGLEGQPSLSADHLDALVAAYTAYLYSQGHAEAVGDPREGIIVLPGKSLP